ncbi:helix-turn-helix domain-containing protein, partial [Klebsiella pneumoniae]|uniref:helix-turn-helix domain-containing protein n=1 Tax=Klebsiella pneumoniae TaxID=573 RepID=UPI00210A8D6D
VTLKMPAFEWVHVQLHQQKGMISLSPPTICNSATLLDDLKKRGITFIAIKDRIDTNAPVIGEIYTHLMAIFSSFERNRNIERTRSGLAAARARGRVGGRKPSLSEEDVKQIRILLADPEMTVGAVAKRFNVSRMTIYRYTTKS